MREGEIMMRTAIQVLVLFFVGLLVSCASETSATQPREAPQLHFDASVAEDFRTLANDTWVLFLSTFEGRTNCFGDVTLRTDKTLSSRAAYDPNSATVTVRVPGTPAFLQAALVHEWAHHVEFHCAEHQSVRAEIIAALELPVDTTWQFDHSWAESPSENYAEAAVELVLGDHPLPTKIRVKPEVVQILSDWAVGE